ncbi:MAG: DUF4190 domain-containing protein [Phycisphaerae bacterium]|nr:DUF4190 domain-containing protein [Phycisphaerae bacterium]
MVCSKCGVQNNDGSTHCTNCGSVLVDAATHPVAGQVQAAAMQVVPKTSGLAIAAFVMGLLSFCGLWPLLGLPAIICGIIALINISKSNGRFKGTGFAVTGLVIPVVLGPIMMAILMPALSHTRKIAMRVVCGTNLKGLSTAMIVYNDEYPMPEAWCDLLMQEADVSPKSFQCPEEPEGSFSYAINKNVYEIEPGKMDAQMVVLFEANLGRNGVGGPEDLVLRHERNGRLGCNIAFADGHTEFVAEDRIAELQWTAE